MEPEIQLPGDCRAVILDMDGTMFDTEVLYHQVGIEMLARRGREFTMDLAIRIMGVPGREAMAIVKDEHALPESPEDLYEESQRLLRAKIDRELPLMPGLFELLDRIEGRGLPKAVCTSTERALTDLMLAAYDLHRRFDFTLTRDDVQRGKPDPEIYLTACRRLGLEPRNVVVLEDSYNGTLAACAAGCRCIAVPHPLTRHLDFSHAALIAENLLDQRLLALAGLGA